MFYKIAKILSKTAIVFGFMCMVGGCSVEQQELKQQKQMHWTANTISIC